MKKRINAGFTVLEFLIVIAIMSILMYIVLSNLSASREKTIDEKKVTDLKTVVLGLEQYKQVCGVYPKTITKDESCPNMSSSSATLGNFITNIDKYKFNTTGSDYLYFPIAYNGNSPTECNGYHLGVYLQNTVSGIVAAGDARPFDSQGYLVCDGAGSAIPFDGATDNIFDIIQ